MKKLTLQQLENKFGHRNWKINKLIGGRTNNVFECKDAQNHVIVRFYGNETDKLIDRNLEIKNIEMLNRHDLAPKIRYKFKGGMIIDYIEGEILGYKEEGKGIAELMKRWHSIKKDEPVILWNQIWKWYNIAMEKYSDIFIKINVKYFIKDLEMIICSKERKTGFCHNDLLHENIIKDDKGNIFFIDYEYSGNNYISFDIANHFCEYAGVNNEFFKIPDKKYMRKWLINYCNEDVIDEIELFIPVVHFFWGLWGLCRAGDIDSYDYGLRKIMEGIVQFFKLKAKVK